MYNFARVGPRFELLLCQIENEREFGPARLQLFIEALISFTKNSRRNRCGSDKTFSIEVCFITLCHSKPSLLTHC